jgi:hypothetical protein
MTLPYALKYYRHRYGGIYSVQIAKAISTVDKSLWVVYNHVYPFEQQTWIRPYNEWCEDGRFIEMTDHVELSNILRRDRNKFQEEILEARASSKRDK